MTTTDSITALGDTDDSSPAIVSASAILDALRHRLQAVHTTLTGQIEVPRDEAAYITTSRLVGDLMPRLRREPSPAESWLVFVAIAASLPTEDDVVELVRRLELDGSEATTHWLMRIAHSRAAHGTMPLAHLTIVTDAMAVDVDFVSRHELNTGIQRVVRETVARWDRDHDLVLMAWTASGSALRGLDKREHARAAHWGVPTPERDDRSDRLVVPWRTTVFLPDSVNYLATARMRALARFSGNRVVVLGYDTIPVTSGEAVPDVNSERFGKYLSVIKHAKLIVGISASSVEEFSGFGDMLSAQGLAAPMVRECVLPADVSTWPVTERLDTEVDDGVPPLVLCVGSHSPHKNQLALLHAAQRLWDEGVEFDLLLIGSSAWMDEEFEERLAELKHGSYRVEVARRASDAELARAYARARVTVFPSLHEGFGLPVAESLALGVPVVTSNYGSTAQIGADGGVLLVDPRDDSQLVSALRQMLTDDALRDRMAEEASSRPVRTWDDYASELWSVVTEMAE